MKQITKNELIELGGIYIENVIDGFNKYKAYQVKGTFSQYERWLKKSMEENETVYADFYFTRITKDNLSLFEEKLSKSEMERLVATINLCREQTKGEFAIIKLDEELALLLLKISYEELLFSSFYFPTLPLTVWTNYEGEFVFFTLQHTALQFPIE